MPDTEIRLYTTYPPINITLTASRQNDVAAVYPVRPDQR